MTQNRILLEIVADLLQGLDEHRRDGEEMVYIPRCPFWCCSSCGLSEMDSEIHEYYDVDSEDLPTTWMFFHDQDASRFEEDPTQGIYLTWRGNGPLLVELIQRSNRPERPWVSVEWDGNPRTRILIRVDKRLIDDAAAGRLSERMIG